jgi:hypothetical protein
MYELFKGLIGAELTLLGVPNQALPQSVASEPVRALPRIDAHATAVTPAIAQGESAVDEKPGVEFHESHYRIAAG